MIGQHVPQIAEPEDGELSQDLAFRRNSLELESRDGLDNKRNFGETIQVGLTSFMITSKALMRSVATNRRVLSSIS